MNKNEFEIINDNGESIKCNALFTFESDETNKNYIIYTDNTTDEEGNKKITKTTQGRRKQFHFCSWKLRKM